jgi:hypothetical protein
MIPPDWDKLRVWMDEMRFLTLPARLRRGVALMEWRLRHGLRWKGDV